MRSGNLEIVPTVRTNRIYGIPVPIPAVQPQHVVSHRHNEAEKMNEKAISSEEIPLPVNVAADLTST